MKFRTAYSPQVRKSSSPGDVWKKKYVRHVDENGKRSIKESAPENLHSIIQTSRNGICPEELFKRFTMGDTSAIMPDLSSYADLSDVPTSLEDAQKRVIQCRELYNSLPKNVKAFYDNDITKLVSAIDDKSFFEKWSDKPVKKVVSGSEPSFSGSEIEKLKEILKSKESEK